MLDVETFLIFFYFVILKFGSNGPGIHDFLYVILRNTRTGHFCD